MIRPFLLLAIASAVSSCGGDAAVSQVITYDTDAPGIQAGYVGVTPAASGLRVVNQTERPIYLMAANAETLALLDWAPCTGGTNCPPLAQGQQREIPYTVALAYEATTKQYTVYWWNVTVQADGTAKADNLHNLTVSR